MAESLRLPEVLAEALTTKATLLWHRPHESGALLQEAIRIARANDLPAAGLRAQFNFSGLAIEHDRLAEARAVLHDALALARLRGDRPWEMAILGQMADVLVGLGEWDEASSVLDLSGDLDTRSLGISLMLAPAISLFVGRGQIAEARALLVRWAMLRDSSDRQTEATYLLAEARVGRAEGRCADALIFAEQSIEGWRLLHQPHYLVETFVEAIEASIELGDLDRAEALLRELEDRPSIERRPLLDGQAHRLRAKLEGDAAGAHSVVAAAAFRELGMQYWLAVALVERADQEREMDRGERDLCLAEARAIFERLRASPWLTQIDRVAAVA